MRRVYALLLVLVSTAAQGSLDDAWHHGVRGLGADLLLLSDRFETAQIQWGVELGGTFRGGFALQAGASWAGHDAGGSRVVGFIGGFGLNGVWVASPRFALRLAADFDGATNGPDLFIARAQARVALYESECGLELLAGPGWVQTLASDQVSVRSGAGVSVAIGYGCHR